MLNLDNIGHVFQPIIRMANQKIVGYEALVRHLEYTQPEVLFTRAMEGKQHNELDMLSMEKAILKFDSTHKKALFLNIYPTTLLTTEFPIFIERLVTGSFLDPHTLVLELNETSKEEAAWEVPVIYERIHFLRQLGIEIALDDVGAGATSLKRIIEINPDAIKIDRFFSKDLMNSVHKQEILQFFVGFSRNHGIKLVLEGIECSEDFLAAQQLGVPYVQGYFLGKPQSTLSRDTSVNV